MNGHQRELTPDRPARRADRRGRGRTGQTTPVLCGRCQVPLARWRGDRLTTLRAIVTIRRSGRTTIVCNACSARIELSVRTRPIIWIG